MIFAPSSTSNLNATDSTIRRNLPRTSSSTACRSYWNEVLAQDLAHCGLASIESDVRASAVYFAFRNGLSTVIVMDYTYVG